VHGGFRPDIQGLRAIAVLAVLVDHAGVPFFGGGYVGVDVFFVISGFLITGQLLDRLRATGRIGFADFYARRARRILPAALVVVMLSVVGALIWMPPLLLPQTLGDAIATVLYVPNYAFAAQGTDYLTVAAPSLFQHYWSLGVEEQFYLLWPALLGVVYLVRRSRLLLGIAISLVIAVSLVLCVVMTARDQPWAFFPLWTRAWELGAGALLAVVVGRSRSDRPLLRPVPAAVVGWAGLAAIATSTVAFSSTTAFPGLAAVLPVAGAAAVILGGSPPSRGGPVVLLGRRPLLFVGAISYSLYLVHWPILVLAQAAAGPYAELPVVATVALAAAAIPIAWALHRLVEDPARRAGWLSHARPRRTLVATGAAVTAVAALSALALAVTIVQPLNDGHSVQASAPSAPPDATAVVPTNLAPSLRTAADDNPALYDDGCEVGYTPSIPHPCLFGDVGAPRVVLFGDSHAAQWFPALNEIAGTGAFRLETETKSACPSADVELLWGGGPYTRCGRWRDAVIEQLRADPPSLVILANYSAPDFAHRADEAGQWERGLERTIAQLSTFTRVAVIADTPDLKEDPAVCLSAHLDQASLCGRASSLALDGPTRAAEHRATASTGTPLIDLTSYLCTAEFCPAIIGSTLVYRDSHHLTATFSSAMADVLAARISLLMRSA
jgi:peptidoglycan/LPS O-acetylase OafA/YrhL